MGEEGELDRVERAQTIGEHDLELAVPVHVGEHGSRERDSRIDHVVDEVIRGLRQSAIVQDLPVRDREAAGRPVAGASRDVRDDHLGEAIPVHIDGGRRSIGRAAHREREYLAGAARNFDRP